MTASKNLWSLILKYTGTFLGMIILGFLLLLISNLLPTGRIELHVRESAAAILPEGDYWSITLNENTARLDNFTDAIMLLTSGYSGEEGALEKSIYNYRIYKKNASKGESVANCGILPKKEQKRENYYWYWCGYQVVLKPLLFFMNFMEIRRLNSLLLLFEIGIFSLALQQRKKTRYIFPFFLSVGFMNLGTVSVSLQFSTAIHLALISSLIFLFEFDREKRIPYSLFFMIIGMLTSYFDFLTTPILTLVYPLVLFVILETGENFKKDFIRTVIYSALWSVGYLGMWGSKWILSSILTGKNHIKKGIEKIQLRSGNTLGDARLSVADIFRMAKNYLMNSHFLALLLVCIAIFAICAFLSKGYKNRRGWITTGLLFMISLYPFIWFCLAKNHSIQHSFFTFRTLAGFIFAAGAGFLPLIDSKKGAESI